MSTKDRHITQKTASYKQCMNSLDKYYNATKYAISKSIIHQLQNYLDAKTAENTQIINNIALHQSDYGRTQELQYLMSKTWSSEFLDCDARKSLWKEWLTKYLHKRVHERIQYLHTALEIGER